jgi:RNA polymerase primary sigma factor
VTTEDHLNLRLDIAKAVAQLKPVQANVLRLRYGLSGSIPHSVVEVADAFWVTRPRIYQIENLALRSIRTKSYSSAWSDFFKAYGTW